MKKTFLLSCIMSFNMISLSAQDKVFINELMPSNVNGIMDDRYNFPDSWVELYNAGDKDIDISGWYLSNDKDELNMWQVPSECIIPAKGYKLIYLDKEDKNLHTNFRLDIKGEILYLTLPDGKTKADQSVKYDKLAPNNAFGRISDGKDSWGWMTQPTPGSRNLSSKVVSKDKIVSSVVFSQKGGLFSSAVTVELAPKEDEKLFEDHIYYTTDGTEPTLSSFHYTQPIKFDTTTMLRARIIKEGYLEQPSQAASYLYPGRELNLPVISIITDPKYLWDDMIGMYTDGKNGAYFFYEDRYVNWAQNWRRPVNVEYFVNGKQQINQLGEMRIHGGASKEKPQKSWAVYANKRFGTKRFDYAFFQEKKPMDDGYKSFLLRNSGQDFNRSFICDALNQYLLAGMETKDLDYQAYQPAITFINGEYWGIYNLRERSNEDFVASNYDTEDIDMVENFNEWKSGTSEHFDAFFSKIKQGGMNYQELDRWMDINESLNYFILETFIANHDWPNNNIVCWRKSDGGKWRWLVKDTDFSAEFGNLSNAFEHIEKEDFGNKILSTIIKACWKDKTFRNEFIDRYTVYLGDIFHKDATTALVDSFANQISEEMKYARPRWSIGKYEYMDYTYWQKNIKDKRNWFKNRPEQVFKQMQSFFELDTTVAVSIRTDLPEEIAGQAILISGNTVERPIYDGKFFANREMQISLVERNDTDNFKGWSIIETDKEGHQTRKIVKEQSFTFKADTTVACYEIEAIITADSLPEEGPLVANESILPVSDLTVTGIYQGIRIQSAKAQQLPVYTLDGKLVKVVDVPVGISTTSLQTGLYVINQEIISIY